MARSVLSCMQKKAGRVRPSNKASIGMVRHVEKLRCVSQDFYLFFARKPNTVHPEKGKRSSSTDLQLWYSRTAEHFIIIREKRGLYINVIRQGSSMKEALGHLHTNSVMRTLRCGPKKFARCQAWKWAYRFFFLKKSRKHPRKRRTFLLTKIRRNDNFKHQTRRKGSLSIIRVHQCNMLSRKDLISAEWDSRISTQRDSHNDEWVD